MTSSETIRPFDQRVASETWPRVSDELDSHGCALIEGLLSERECRALGELYACDALFRKRVVMARHGFGQGEYKYFARPLPVLVQTLRAGLYAELAPIANRWHDALRIPGSFPSELAAFLERCHAAGQAEPTPLLLEYRAGDYNCLHQDLYGEYVFPLQVAVLLSAPGDDFTGGEFVMTEQRPRMQSRPTVVPLRRGDAVVFAVNQRPAQGLRGSYRVRHRHGVSRLRSGLRRTLGIIFHDATA